MLRHFPPTPIEIIHNKRDYYLIAFVFVAVALCFLIDATASHRLQMALGVAGWICLFAMLVGECKYVRAQILVAVIFATLGEQFASLYMAGYTYRLQNIPAFVPPGHGIVYLTAVVIGRCGFFQQHVKAITYLVVWVGGLWSVVALTGVMGRNDQVGALLFCVYLLFLFKGYSYMVYLGAFFITTWVELIGTSMGNWYWAAVDPASTLTQGNPPSGIVAWYCLVDAVAIAGAGMVLNIASKGQTFCFAIKNSIKTIKKGL